MTVLPGLPGRPNSHCLGDRVADLADGRLTLSEAETAFAHVAVCDRCRVALDTERAASAALASRPAGPSEDFLARLLAIAVTEAEAARPSATPVVATQVGSRPAGAAGVRPGSPATVTRPASRRRRIRTAVGSVAGVAVLAVAAAVGGAPATVGGPSPAAASSIAPVVDALADEHSASTQRMPFSGPLVINAAVYGGSGSSDRP